MKSASNLLKELQILPHFSKSSVRQLGEQLGMREATVDTYISRFLKRKQLIQLKKGLYVSTEFFGKNKNDTSFLLHLANVTRTPSYISSWTALQYYDLTTEAVRTIMSVTPKVTRTYQTKAGTFAYQSIQPGLFDNFSLEKGAFEFFIASPAKALFDLLYFRTHQFRGISKEKILKLIEELRINFEEMEASQQENFNSMISLYFHE